MAKKHDPLFQNLQAMRHGGFSQRLMVSDVSGSLSPVEPISNSREKWTPCSEAPVWVGADDLDSLFCAMKATPTRFGEVTPGQ